MIEKFLIGRRFDAKRYLKHGPEIPGSVANSAATYFPEIEFRPVQTREELLQASELVYQEYLESGYIKRNANRWKLSLFQILPTTITFIAFHRRFGVLATMTLVQDSPLGLPMDSMFRFDLDELRYKGHKPVEMSMFATDREKVTSRELMMSQSERLIMNLHLIRVMVDYIRLNTDKDLVVECCHPKHDGFYKLLEFQPMGQLSFNRSVQGNPAIARYIHWPTVLSDGPKNTSHRLFTLELPAPTFFKEPYRLSKQDIETFFVDHSNILGSANERQRQWIQHCYPELDINELIQKKSIIDYVVDGWEAALAQH